LDGATYIEVPHDDQIDLTSQFTLNAWIKPAKLQDMRVIDKNTAGIIDGITFDIQVVGVFYYTRLCAGTMCALGARPLTYDNWYFVSVVFSQGAEGVKLYINGFLDSSFANFASASTNTLPIRFGAPASGYADFFQGEMDDVSIWSIPLSMEEVRQLAFKRPRGNEDGLVGYWSFNEGDGGEVHDWSWHHRHGKLAGTPKWEPSPTKPLALNPCW